VSAAWKRIRALARKAPPFLVAGLAAYGVWLLHEIVTTPAEYLVWIGVAVLVVLRLLASRNVVVYWLAVVWGAIVVPTLALLGANGLWALVGWSRPHPLIGLIIAAVFIALVAWVYFRWWWFTPPPLPRLGVAAVVIVLLVAPPAIAYAVKPPKKDKSLPTQEPVSLLDVTVVRAARSAPKLEPATVAGWRLSFSSGRANGRRVVWDGGEAPLPRKNADPVLVLLPDERARRRELSRWLAIADSVAERQTPILALLPANDGARLRRWNRKLRTDTRHEESRRHGSALSVDESNRHSLGVLALRLAVDAPTAEVDLALAGRHRPALFFDSGEHYATPLNIDSLLASGAIRLCPNDQPGLALYCTEVHGSEDLRNGPNHLEFETGEVAELATGDTAIYVHVTHKETAAGLKRTYLDYWWYLPDNPTYAANGALCGAGFVIIAGTCFDHQSDWEGVTVVLDAESEPATPKAVNYAAHEFVTRFDWSRLKELWETRPLPQAAAEIDTDEHPLVFIARGSHAAYPLQCRGACRQPTGSLRENHYDGGQPWRGNEEAGCALICLAALPTHNKGQKRARWNAYEGQWGSADCDFLNLCSRSNAPTAPGAHDRYEKPWCADGQGRDLRHWKGLPRCPDLPRE
jgi:hypothetical protein